MLNGADVTSVAQWADAEVGEVGLYPHRIGEGGSPLLLLSLNEMTDIKAILPLVSFGPDGYFPKIALTAPPIITVAGEVQITFKE